MKSDEDRGPLGAWARNARIAAGYATAREAAEAANRAGIPLRLQHLQGIESGWDRAGRELLLRLGELYGSEPPGVERQQPRDDHWLAEVRSAVAEGVEVGLVRALARLGLGEAQLPPHRPRPRQ